MTSATPTLGGCLRTAMVSIVFATCTAIGAVGTAHAGSADAPEFTVRYSDLNLSTHQGALVLYGRIVAAAHQVCAVDDIRDLRGMRAEKLCTEQAIAQAVRDVNSPALASVYAARQQHG